MKKTLLFLALPLMGLTALAQDSTFQLKDYKYRTLGYRALTISIGMASGLSSSTFDTLYDRLDKWASLAPSSISYQKVKSTDRVVQTSSLSFNASGATTSQTVDGNKRSFSPVQSYLSWQQDQRFYRAAEWYWEFGQELTGRLTNLNQKDTAGRHKNGEVNSLYSVTVGLGKGRIEAVQDAQMALYILNDLQAQGLLSTPVTRDKAEAFAGLVTSLNNRRIFDFRRRRIYELTQIDSFLRTSGLVSSTNINHFTVINDNWSLAFNPMRLSGTTWYIKFKPTVTYKREINDFTGKPSNYSTHTRLWTLGVTPVVGVERYLPVGLKFQKNMGANLSWQPTAGWQRRKITSNNTLTEYDVDDTESALRFYGFYGLGYSPNNRTLLNATLSVQAGHADDDVSAMNRQWNIRPALNFDTDYFISYRTRLQARIEMSYNYSTYMWAANYNKISKDFYSNFSIGLVHSFF